MIITTTPTIEGHQITEYKGLVLVKWFPVPILFVIFCEYYRCDWRPFRCLRKQVK
ncbi:Uncharacterised protein [Actinobacillus equuli]|nr:Uncharacterised protein [Actinobacillus equuli]